MTLASILVPCFDDQLILFISLYFEITEYIKEYLESTLEVPFFQLLFSGWKRVVSPAPLKVCTIISLLFKRLWRQIVYQFILSLDIGNYEMWFF